MTLHASWRGRAAAFGSPLMILALGLVGVLDDGASGVSLAIVAVGLALELVSLWDFPLDATFGPEGVVRRCVLRREVLAWGRIEALHRAPRSWRHRASPGGLAAAAGRRRWLLVDRTEGEEEYDAVVAGMAVWAPEVTVPAARPPAGTPPTWLYRRRRSPSG